ncbi:MAG TPA: DMT family transporter [Solirubrobacteraceae bacterium]|nr:DMT family transporter [Solirubrobacteraceae bacterium]
MDRGSAVLLTALTGGLIALQAPINSGLGKQIGTFQAAFFSLLVGTTLLCGIAALAGTGGLSALAGVRDVGWVYLLGGLLGAAYVTTVLVTVRTLGAGGIVAATISGQLTMSVIVDQFGWLGVERAPATPWRILGLVLLAAGTFLVVRESH